MISIFGGLAWIGCLIDNLFLIYLLGSYSFLHWLKDHDCSCINTPPFLQCCSWACCRVFGSEASFSSSWAASSCGSVLLSTRYRAPWNASLKIRTSEAKERLCHFFSTFHCRSIIRVVSPFVLFELHFVSPWNCSVLFFCADCILATSIVAVLKCISRCFQNVLILKCALNVV